MLTLGVAEVGATGLGWRFAGTLRAFYVRSGLSVFNISLVTSRMPLPAAAKTLLMAGPSVYLAAALLLAGSAGPALAQARPMTGAQATPEQTSGTVIEHWGVYGADGKLADLHVSPVPLTLPAPVSQIGSSNSTQYALLTNGQVWAWGMGGNGQLGNGTTKNSFATPVQVMFPQGVSIASIPTDADPYNSAFAIDTTGHVWAWGYNEQGEFCLGNQTQYVEPVELPFSDVTAVAGASNHATYDVSGTLESCGVNTQGELGNDSTVSSTTPVPVTTTTGVNSAPVTELVASAGNTGALLSNGTYYDWGANNYGEVGNGHTASVLLPYKVHFHSAPTQTVAQIVEGGSGSTGGQSLALLAGGTLWGWGDNTYYQLSNHLGVDQTTPAEINPPGAVVYAAVATSGATSYGISMGGALWAWGCNSDGEVGNGHRVKTSLPVTVASGVTEISATARDVVIATTGS
jgi:alpha-tubulin suppressor-like RCC1 family protein